VRTGIGFVVGSKTFDLRRPTAVVELVRLYHFDPRPASAELLNQDGGDFRRRPRQLSDAREATSPRACTTL
jgi:hypothetical protein